MTTRFKIIFHLNIVKVCALRCILDVIAFFRYIYAPVPTFIDLGAKPGPCLVPRRPLTDEKRHPQCSTEKSPPPDRAIERTNCLQDCQNGAQ